MPRYFFHVQMRSGSKPYRRCVSQFERGTTRSLAHGRNGKSTASGHFVKIIVTDERGLPVLELLVVNECRGDRHKSETSAPLSRCGSMDRSAERDEKRKTAMKIVTERLRRYYDELP